MSTNTECSTTTSTCNIGMMVTPGRCVLSVAHPLSQSVHIVELKWENVPTSTVQDWVSFLNRWLPKGCFYCGVLGDAVTVDGSGTVDVDHSSLSLSRRTDSPVSSLVSVSVLVDVTGLDSSALVTFTRCGFWKVSSRIPCLWSSWEWSVSTCEPLQLLRKQAEMLNVHGVRAVGAGDVPFGEPVVIPCDVSFCRSCRKTT